MAKEMKNTLPCFNEYSDLSVANDRRFEIEHLVDAFVIASGDQVEIVVQQRCSELACRRDVGFPCVGTVVVPNITRMDHQLGIKAAI